MSKKNKELANVSKEDLKKRVTELNKELVKLNAQVATGTSPKNTSAVKNTRRTIARMLMLIGNKDREEKLFGKKSEGKKA